MVRLPAAPVPALVALSLALGSAPPARGDVLELQGEKREDGYVIGRGPREEWFVGTAAGRRQFHRTTVVEVRPSADPSSDFRRYFKALGAKDAEAAAALGAWAKERGIPDLAPQAFERALALDPGNATARRGLGHVNAGGEWLTGKEAEEYLAEQAEREALAETWRAAIGAKPEVVDRRHWRYVDFLGDGKCADRLKDLEAAWDEAVRAFGSDPWKGRGLAVALEGLEQYHTWCDTLAKRLPGVNATFLDYFRKATGMKWNEPPMLVRSDAPDRGAMHGAFLHTAGHLLLNNWRGIHRGQPFWIEEGFGGWIENAVLHTNSSYCYGHSRQGYGNTFRGSKQWEVEFPDWKALSKEAAAKNEFLPLDQLDMLPQGDYGRREVGQAFSLVAYLLREHSPEKFRSYVALVKGGEKSPVAFRKAFDYTFETVEPDWKRWVMSGSW